MSSVFLSFFARPQSTQGKGVVVVVDSMWAKQPTQWVLGGRRSMGWVAKAHAKSLLPLMFSGHQVVSRLLPAIRTFQCAATDWELWSDREEVIQKTSLRYLRVYEAQFAVATSQDPSRHFLTKTTFRL